MFIPFIFSPLHPFTLHPFPHILLRSFFSCLLPSCPSIAVLLPLSIKYLFPFPFFRLSSLHTFLPVLLLLLPSLSPFPPPPPPPSPGRKGGNIGSGFMSRFYDKVITGKLWRGKIIIYSSFIEVFRGSWLSGGKRGEAKVRPRVEGTLFRKQKWFAILLVCCTV